MCGDREVRVRLSRSLDARRRQRGVRDASDGRSRGDLWRCHLRRRAVGGCRWRPGGVGVEDLHQRRATSGSKSRGLEAGTAAFRRDGAPRDVGLTAQHVAVALDEEPVDPDRRVRGDPHHGDVERRVACWHGRYINSLAHASPGHEDQDHQSGTDQAGRAEAEDDVLEPVTKLAVVAQHGRQDDERPDDDDAVLRDECLELKDQVEEPLQEAQQRRGRAVERRQLDEPVEEAVVLAVPGEKHRPIRRVTRDRLDDPEDRDAEVSHDGHDDQDVDEFGEGVRAGGRQEPEEL